MDSEESFEDRVTRAFVSGTIGGTVASSVINMMRGRESRPYNFTDNLISGLMTGTAFASYPIAVKVLSSHWSRFLIESESPFGNKLLVYVTAGATAAAITTIVNIPLIYLQARRNDERPDLSVGGLLKRFFSSLFPTIGYAITVDALRPVVPIPRFYFGNWARDQFLFGIGSLGGMIASTPFHFVRTRFLPYYTWFDDDFYTPFYFPSTLSIGGFINF